MNSLRPDKIAIAAFLTVLVTCTPAFAHNIFVLIEDQESGPDMVDVIFEHSPYPGKGVYNQPLLDRGKTWVQKPGSDEATSLTLKEAERLGKKFLQTETTSERPRAVIHSCEWGIYKGRLNYFHGKYLDASSPELLSKMARTPELPLDLVVTASAEGLSVQVIYEDKPLANKKVWVWMPGAKEATKTTDAEGNIALAGMKEGLYCFAAIHRIDGPKGEFEGDAYEGLMHGTTVNLRWPLK
jgi:hypothetical protein